MTEQNGINNFTFIDKKFNSIYGKENKDFLIKWGLKGKLRTFMFTFDHQFHVGIKDAFLLKFFQDDQVLQKLEKLKSNGDWEKLENKPKRINVEEVNCSLLSVEIFDRITEKGIVRESGSIRGCLDEYYEDIVISDELRKLLLLEESDSYDIYSSQERNEFLFRLFKHLCIGGQVCQFEDKIQPYIDVTRSIYKDLISVQKDSNTKKLKTVSYVFKIELFDDGNKKIYPNNTVIEQDFCYVIIDPYKRHLIVLYNRFDGPLFIE